MKNPDAKAKNILLVEDERAICDVCRRVLVGDEFDIDIAENGELAQQMIGEKEYDLCILDIRIPVVSGDELYVWLLQEHPEVVNRVIFTTGDIMGGDTIRFIERTTRPLLAKPFTSSELITIVRDTLAEAEDDSGDEEDSGR
jgi:DNA-binding response OmpR family regulator